MTEIAGFGVLNGWCAKDTEMIAKPEGEEDRKEQQKPAEKEKKQPDKKEQEAEDDTQDMPDEEGEQPVRNSHEPSRADCCSRRRVRSMQMAKIACKTVRRSSRWSCLKSLTWIRKTTLKPRSRLTHSFSRCCRTIGLVHSRTSKVLNLKTRQWSPRLQNPRNLSVCSELLLFS